jgi:hypothetical protein
LRRIRHIVNAKTLAPATCSNCGINVRSRCRQSRLRFRPPWPMELVGFQPRQQRLLSTHLPSN